MKKTLSLLIAAIMIFAAFSACAKPNVEGVYTLKSINGMTPYEYFQAEASDENIDVADLLSFLGLTEETINQFMVITLEKDGKAKVQVFGEETEEGTWELTKINTVTLKMSDEVSELAYLAGTLTVKDDDMIYVLSKN